MLASAARLKTASFTHGGSVLHWHVGHFYIGTNSYEWVRSICEYARSKVKVSDRQKIELGIPLYGRDWANGTATSVLYDKFVALKEKYPDSIPTYSDEEKEVTFSYVDVSGVKHTVWFSNNQSVMDRIALIRTYQFRGAAFWAASYEEATLWQEIAQAQP